MSDDQDDPYVRLLLLGDSKVGKTTSLASLVAAGYKLRILDFDNLSTVFMTLVRRTCPELIDNIERRTLRDRYKGTSIGTVIDGKPKAWTESLKMLNQWTYTKDTGEVIDLGDPGEWGLDTILVIDSLSRWCDAAYAFHEVMTPIGKKGDQDGRAVYGNAQDDVEKQLAALTSKNFHVHVIVICHGVYMTLDDGTTKIFPQGVGQKLSPKIPQYFPDYIRYIHKGGKRTIQLESDSMISLANTNPWSMPKELSTDTGLAEFFAVLRSPPAKSDGEVATTSAPPRPKALTLRRI
jgi:hypothetical protein